MDISKTFIWVKRVFLALGLLIIIGFVVLEILRYIAFKKGATEVSLPKGSEIASKMVKSGYSDAYRFRVNEGFSFNDIKFTQGKEIWRNKTEILYEGRAPGLKFLASYHLSKTDPNYFTVSTIVYYESFKGEVYFFFVKPFHRRVVPYMIGEMIRDE